MERMKDFINHKKAYQVGDILPLAIAFVVLAVALGLGAEVLSDIKDTQDDDIAVLGTNESLTWGGNNTFIGLSQINLVEDSEAVYNNATLLTKGRNYTIDYAGGKIFPLNETSEGGDSRGLGTGEWITSDLNISYSHLIGSYQRNASTYGLGSVNTLSKWIPTIALVVVIAIIIGVLLFYLARQTEMGG